MATDVGQNGRIEPLNEMAKQNNGTKWITTVMDCAGRGVVEQSMSANFMAMAYKREERIFFFF